MLLYQEAGDADTELFDCWILRNGLVRVCSFTATQVMRRGKSVEAKMNKLLKIINPSTTTSELTSSTCSVRRRPTGRVYRDRGCCGKLQSLSRPQICCDAGRCHVCRQKASRRPTRFEQRRWKYCSGSSFHVKPATAHIAAHS